MLIEVVGELLGFMLEAVFHLFVPRGVRGAVLGAFLMGAVVLAALVWMGVF